MYRFYNANSKGNKVQDCTIRAISLATHRNWDNTYKELSNEARKMGLMMDSVEFIEYYLDERYSRFCKEQTTVGEFAKKYNKGTYLVTMAGHITCIKDGIVYDTFNPKDRIMWCAWYVPKKRR